MIPSCVMDCVKLVKSFFSDGINIISFMSHELRTLINSYNSDTQIPSYELAVLINSCRSYTQMDIMDKVL